MTVKLAWPTAATVEDLVDFTDLAAEQNLSKFTPTVETDGQGRILTIEVSGDPGNPPQEEYR